ncbi:RmlC-like cupin domain-containing protein [Amylostereum chailletii]|nr:RmlC-like cupin domain-containing protein [Amylostereum chailletii]
MSEPVFLLTPTVQQYDWGKLGLSSKVAQFADAAHVAAIDDDAPYAELWMGTHPSSPSTVASTSTPLAATLAQRPALLGPAVASQFDTASGSLPFLFKVLAIDKALSIQSHPDKPTAEKLHAAQPSIYKDPNHKPEMALAITPFTALCGFRPLPEIAALLRATPELAALVPAAATADLVRHPSKHALQAVFSAIATAPPSAFQPRLAALVARYSSGDDVHPDEEAVKDLVLTLHAQFPGDVGIFCAFLLNHVRLSPGEAIFLGAGEPHAYLSGDIVECMANSDNVIRVGLTPKLRDVPNLLATLTYAAAPPAAHRVPPAPFPPSSPHTTLYDPPVPEFAVLHTSVPARASEAHRAIAGPSIALVAQGAGRLLWQAPGDGGTGAVDVAEGSVVFVGADVAVDWAAGAGGLGVYRAFVEA